MMQPIEYKSGIGRPVPWNNPKTGYSTLLYPIGMMAQHLGRSSERIRQWEIAGLIPRSPFKIDGVRYYSEEMIKTAEEAAERSRLQLSGLNSIKRTSFTKNVLKAWKLLSVEMFGYDIWKGED